MTVPKIIHQFWMGDKPKPKQLMDTVKSKNPDFEYIFWDEERCKSELKIQHKYQIKINFMEELNGKCDMYRWLILEQYGGIFVDADIICIEPFDDFLFTKSFFCWENEIMRPNLCATTVMAFEKNHIIPKMAIDWIMNNRITSPAWKSVGPQLLSGIYHELSEKDVVNVFPSYFFLPDHLTGYKYKGHGKVYATHLWGSTFNHYDNLTKQIPVHHTTPSNWIDIVVPSGLNEKRLKEIIQGIKGMEGHFGINIKCDRDIGRYLKSSRFIEQSNTNSEESNMDLLNEYDEPVNLNMEFIEQQLMKHYIKPDDKVLELGARYGSVSITTNKILKDKKSHYVVEPDKKVWDCLERNMKANNTEFNIIKGVIGKNKVEINGHGYASHTIVSDKSDIDNYELPNVNFNVLIADCEGYLETFYDENFDLFNNLRMVIFETDRPEACDYDKIIKGLLDMGFIIKQKIPEPGMPGMYHYVFIKETDILLFDTRKDMITHYANKINKPKICELGVYKGEFLDFLVDNIDYGSIEGVDLFEGIIDSGDVDGNNVEYADLEKQLILLNDKYKDNNLVTINKSYTDKFLSNQSDDTFDIIYIDADHSYTGAKRDIELSYKKIKSGGYIMGHDYEMNMDKAKQYYNFGVTQAVNEFCDEYNQTIISKGMDGCVSFCIQINK